MHGQSKQFMALKQGRNSFRTMLLLIFVVLPITNGQFTATYPLYDASVARPLSFSMEIHPPEPASFYDATLESISGSRSDDSTANDLHPTDQADLGALATAFGALHGGSSAHQLAQLVQGQLWQRSGWEQLYDLLGLPNQLPPPASRGFVLLPVLESGLGRRLMTMAAASQVARALGRQLVVAWASSDHCGVSFSDLFDVKHLPLGTTVVEVDNMATLRRLALLRPSLLEATAIDASSHGSSGSRLLAALLHEEGGDDRTLPAVPLLSVSEARISAHVLQQAYHQVKAPLLALDPLSGFQFGLPQQSVAEWRARQHDFLATLKPSAIVARRLASLRRAVRAAQLKATTWSSQKEKDGSTTTSSSSSSSSSAHSEASSWIGVHVRRDDLRVDAPNLMLPEIPSSSSSSTDTTSNRNDEVKWTPAGWSEVPWHTYADLATTAAGAADTDTADPDTAAQQQGDGKKQAPSAVLVFSNELGAARAVAREMSRQQEVARAVGAAIVVVIADGTATFLDPNLASTVDDSEGSATAASVGAATVAITMGVGTVDTMGEEEKEEAQSFTGRDRFSMLSAAVEWFALSQCDLVISSMRSEYARTASLRSSRVGVEVVPRLLSVFAHGASDLQGLDAGLSPNDTIPCNNPEAAGGGMDHFLSSQWHLEHANCLKRKHDDDHLNDENAGDGGSHDRSSHGSGGGSGGDTVNRTRRNHDREEQQFCPLGRRFLHIGRTTAHVDSSAAAVFAEEHPEWLVVDSLPNGSVDGLGAASNVMAIASMEDLSVFSNHCFEGVGRALQEWYRVLKPGGALMVAVPDMVALAELLLMRAAKNTLSAPHEDDDGEGGEAQAENLGDTQTILAITYGGQRDATDFHRSGFTEHFLREYLRQIGFCGIVRLRNFHRFPHDSSTLDYLGVPISLNLHATACASPTSAIQ